MTPAKRKEKDLADELQESYEMRNDSEPSDDQERDQILTGPALQGPKNSIQGSRLQGGNKGC